MVRIAASMSEAVRSGCLVVAISCSCSRVTVPTLVVSGLALPFGMPAAFLSSTAAGGVFIINVKLRSE